MNEALQGVLIGFISSLAVSILTTYVTVRLSLKQFYSQRWWERKAEAYSSIIEQLSYLQYYYRKLEGAELGAESLDPDRRKELGKKATEAMEFLEKSAAAGAYAVSKETADAVFTLIQELVIVRGVAEGPMDLIGSSWEALTKCMAVVREQAKVDLQGN
jgi:hypothetical protein